MAKDYIRYDLLAQEALRGVVRKVLSTAAQQGLPGEHHFYISIATTVPGVMLSQRLRDQYPDEMTIILQHQFWDLDITDTEFSVTLSFGGSPERLTVPFAAIKGFFDPSVQFGLEFVVGDEGRGVADPDAGDAPPAMQPAPPAGPDASNDSSADSDTGPAEATEYAEKAGEEDTDGDGATVVSLDAFRRKG
jgi:hypothetical protein